jgi:sialate O-acetylesterase
MCIRDRFELAGEDGVYYSAQAELAGQTLRLRAQAVQEPVSARYAWVNYGLVHCFGSTDLPLAPFLISAK